MHNVVGVLEPNEPLATRGAQGANASGMPGRNDFPAPR